MVSAAKKLRVLWAADGSEASRGAVPLLRQLVLPVAESLTVVNVAPHPIMGAARPDPAFLTGATPASRRNAIESARQAAAFEATNLDPGNLPVEAVGRWGSAIEEILRLARNADLIVMGAKGHSNLSLLVLGSVAQGVVQHATRPVLIVRPNTVAVSKVVVGYDGSPQARRAVDFLERLAVGDGVTYTLANVVEPFTVPASTPVNYRKLAIEEAKQINARHHVYAERSLAAQATRLRGRGRKVETETLSGDADMELAEVIRREQADLVVVGSRKPDLARHYLLGSTAEALVRHSPKSVLVVRS